MRTSDFWLALLLASAATLRADPRLHGTWYDAVEGGNFTVHPDGRFTSAGETGRWSVMGDTFVFRPASGGLESWRYQVEGGVIVATSPAYGTRRFTRVGGRDGGRDEGGLRPIERLPQRRSPSPITRPPPRKVPPPQVSRPRRPPSDARRPRVPAPGRRPAPGVSRPSPDPRRPAPPGSARGPRPALQRAGKGPVLLGARWKPADRKLDFDLPKAWKAQYHLDGWNDISFELPPGSGEAPRAALHRQPTEEPVALDLVAEAEAALETVRQAYPSLQRTAPRRDFLPSGYPAVVAEYSGSRRRGPDRAWAAYMRGEGESVLALIAGRADEDFEARRAQFEALVGSLQFR